MKLRSKMFVLAGVVLIGLLCSTGLGLYLVGQVKVGGPIYQTIRDYKGLLEQIALLKADLNQVRAETLAMIVEQDQDKLAQLRESIGYLRDDADARFASAQQLVTSEDKRVALADAQATWQEFYATLNGEVVPLTAGGRQSEALLIANGIQRMRYERFLEQVSGMVDLLVLEIEELEGQAAANIRAKTIVLIAVSGAILLLVVTVTLLLVRAITRPLAQGVTFAETVARGDLSTLLDIRSQDEIGQLADALNTMVKGLNGLIQRVGLSLEDLSRITRNISESSGRLVEAADQQLTSVEETTSAITEMKFSIQHVAGGVDSLNLSATENTASTLELTASIDEVAQNVEYLAQSVEEVSSSIAQMAASIRQVAAGSANLRDASASTVSSVVEIDASIREVKQNALTTAEIADQVRRDAETGKEAVDSTIAGMADIRRASNVTSDVIASLSSKAENIGSILAVIDGVVDQINLLSLNAAIIAAQAGEHGRGFSVVADEIKKLAERTTMSTREIDVLIQAVQGETRRAVSAIEQTELAVSEGEKLSHNSGELLNQIVTGIQKATRQTGDIARATEEQSRAINSIKRASEQVADMVVQIAGATQQQEKGSELIMGATEKMRGLAQQVKSSTREQSRASSSIASATDTMAGMIRQIQRACVEQNTGSEQIVRSAENISAATTVNHQATRTLDEAVGDLNRQSETLRQELAAFRVAAQEQTDLIEALSEQSE